MKNVNANVYDQSRRVAFLPLLSTNDVGQKTIKSEIY